MCVPGCPEFFMKRLMRRRFFKGVGAMVLAGMAAMFVPPVPADAKSMSFTKAVDLTRTLGDRAENDADCGPKIVGATGGPSRIVALV